MKFLNEIISFDESKYEGLTEDLYAIIISERFNKGNESVIILTNTIFDANKVFEKLKTYNKDVYLFLMDDFVSSVVLASSPELKISRLETIRRINENKKTIVITNLMGYLHFLPKLTKNQQSKKINVDDAINRDNLIGLFEEYGYNRTSLVTTTGEYAVRGYIVDFFGIEEERPTRVELFGDMIESIRYFDEISQMSIESIKNIVIHPYKEMKTENNVSLIEYMNYPDVYKFNIKQINNSYDKLVEDIKNYQKFNNLDQLGKIMFDLSEIKENNIIEIDTINKNTQKNKCQELTNFNSDFDYIEKFINDNLSIEKTIVFCMSNLHQINLLKSYFPTAIIQQSNSKIAINKINIINQKIGKGFILNDYIFVGENDIEKEHTQKSSYRSSLKIGKRISNFDQIKINDYVVHRVHGIGIYNGIVTIEKNGLKTDYIQILYKGNDKVYIPIEKINTIFKYTTKDGVSPVINKLNSIDWEKKKLKARNKINDISDELIELYAERERNKKDAYKSYVEEETFASEFIYEPTPDQLKAIEDINKDLTTTKPMDRLLCGDVGYGKTEVAFRTIFKAVLNGYQVAYLCPTTILSKQQYVNALERFKNYPINIALLNRFVTKKQENKIYDDLEQGKVDIIFGTHKLLNSKLKYKNLDMLIIDEEQKFGVIHKEKIKEIKKNINVLTLSATPIPRTLKMSMSGVRDLSIIDTPPINRYPVQTYVIEENEFIIKDAVYKELSRRGQVFVLYNTVKDIAEEADKISKLIPEASVTFAHGQMNKNDLEEIMQNYIDGKYDVLVCTTIIESGIDIPNVNTLIVIDADRFGLSQLYQLRGRVGRRNQMAYAYLMYDKRKILTETAIKRLNSIQEFTELGSGYKIAMRDLSIRGAGNILGSEQAGFIDSIGIELYLEMINEKIQEISGKAIAPEILDEKNLTYVETHINNNYVFDESIKIEIHKKISEITSKEQLNIVKKEIEDRFGTIDETTNIYMSQRLFENIAKRLDIKQLNQSENTIELIIPEKLVSTIKGDKLLLKIFNIDRSIKIRYHNKRLIVTLIVHKLKKHFIYYLIDIINIFDMKESD